MPITLKQELIEKISATDNENLLHLLLADLEYFSSGTDVIDELSASDLTELQTMAQEPFGHETDTYEDFKNAIAQWRTPSL